MLWTKQRTSKADPQQPDRSRGTQIKTKESLFRKELWVCPFFQIDWNWIRYKDVCRVFMGVSQATDMDWKALKLSRQKELWPPAFLGQEADWGICSTANIKHFCRMSLLRRWEGRTDVSKTEPKHQRGYFQGKQDLTKSQALPERESCQHLPCVISDLLRTRDCFVLFLFSSPRPSFRQSSVGPLSMVVLSPHCVWGEGGRIHRLFSFQVSKPWTVSRQWAMYLFSTLFSGASHGCLEIGHSSDISITEINQCHKSGLFSPEELVVSWELV